MENGVVGTLEAGYTATITPLANGWYRCTATVQLTGTQNLRMWPYLASADNTTNYQGDGTSGLYLAYAQLEQSSYASSLMLPTTEGSTTSRVGDVVTNAGNQSLFSSVNSSGVLYAEIAALADDGVSNRLSISDGTIANRVFIGYNTSDEVWIMLNVGGAVRWQTTNAIDITVSHKIAVRWANEDFSLWVDGSEVDSQSSGTTLPANTLTELSFDDGGGGNDFYGKTKAVEVLPYMSDTEMSLLTSP